MPWGSELCPRSTRTTHDNRRPDPSPHVRISAAGLSYYATCNHRRKCVAREWVPSRFHEQRNAKRRDAGWVRREINAWPGGQAPVGRGDGTAGHSQYGGQRTRPRDRRPGHPLDENAAAYEPSSYLPREDGNAPRSDAGWVTSRDRLHGRVVARRWIVEMAPPVTRNTAVNGRATGPDPRRKQACARSPGTARGSRTRTFIFNRRMTARPCNLSRAEPSPRRCAARCCPRETRFFINRSNSLWPGTRVIWSAADWADWAHWDR